MYVQVWNAPNLSENLLLDGGFVSNVGDALSGRGGGGGLRVSRSREFDLRHTIVVTVETVEVESGALAVYPMLCRMYVSGDYLEREDDDAIALLSSDALPCARHLDFHHPLPLCLSPSTIEGASNRRALSDCIGEDREDSEGVSGGESQAKAVVRVLLCATESEDVGGGLGEEEEEEGGAGAWEVASCIVPLWPKNCEDALMPDPFCLQLPMLGLNPKTQTEPN